MSNTNMESEYNRCMDRIGELKEEVELYEGFMDSAVINLNAKGYSHAKQQKALLLDEVEMLEKHCKKLISTDFGMHE